MYMKTERTILSTFDGDGDPEQIKAVLPDLSQNNRRSYKKSRTKSLKEEEKHPRKIARIS